MTDMEMKKAIGRIIRHHALSGDPTWIMSAATDISLEIDVAIEVILAQVLAAGADPKILDAALTHSVNNMKKETQ